MNRSASGLAGLWIRGLAAFGFVIAALEGGAAEPITPALSLNPEVAALNERFAEGTTLVVGIYGLPAASTVQWFRNGQLLAGQNSGTLLVTPVRPDDAGMYYARVDGSRATQILYATVIPQPRLLNLSLRIRVHAGETPPIAGFVVTPGPYSKRLLVRAIGPGLKQFGIEDFLPQPKIAILNAEGGDEGFIASTNGNDNPFIRAATEKCGAFPLANGTKDVAGIHASLAPGAYTVLLTSGDGRDGVAMVEVYEIPY